MTSSHLSLDDETPTGTHLKDNRKERSTSYLEHLVSDWLTKVQVAFDTQKIELLVDLIDDGGYWRDILTIELDFNSFKKEDIEPYFRQHNLSLPPLGKLSIEHRPNTNVRCVSLQPGVELVESYIKFETQTYRGTGFLRLKIPIADDQPAKAFTFFTQLWEVKGHEEKIKTRRPIGTTHTYTQSTPNWFEQRQEEIQSYGLSAQPKVLIIGAGQSGLMLAARLKCLGLSTLIIDKSDQVGDCWRNRYHSLCLHDPIWADHFPYIPFPDSWPIFIPKDKLANWFQHYSESMELSIWLKTSLLEGTTPSYDHQTGHWSLQLKLPSGTRTLTPRYVVMATGLSGAPQWPGNFSMKDFKGILLHSSDYKNGKAFEGKRAVVIGACNSAHDIAADLWVHGAASVTMVQRSSTYVLSSQHGLAGLLKGSYQETDCPPIDEADLQFTSLPLDLLSKIHTSITTETTKLDKSLLDSLSQVGFKHDPYPAGLLIKFFRQGGGYYIDVGCSKLIAEQKIKLKQGTEIKELTPHTVRFSDNEEIEADVVICATGYGPLKEKVCSIMGSKVSDKLGPIWGPDGQGEIAGTWRLSGHPAFWVMCGNLTLARCYSKHVATQILLQELGLYDKNLPGKPK